MKLSRNYLIAALVLVVLYLLFSRQQKEYLCINPLCTKWLSPGTKNPNSRLYKKGPIKSLDNKAIAYCSC